MLQDMRQALRVIHRNPGYVAAAVLTLAIGIGATTAIFTLTDAVLLRPLDVHDASRVFALRTTNFRGEPYEGFLYRQVVDLKATLANALDLAIQFPDDVIVATPGGLSRRRAAFVSANYFEVLGRPPVRGGDFAVADDSPGAEPRVILGHSFWTSAFAASDSAVGSRLLVSGVAVTIAGVAAPRQRGIDLQAPVDLFLPAHLIQRTTTLPGNTGNYFFQDGSPGFSPGNYWRMFGRLAPGVSRQSAASIAVCRSCTDQKIALVSVQTAAVPARLRGDVSRFSTILFVAVTVVLLMVCANLAGLLLAQTERRRREIGVRLALGASRPRIFMHLVLESAVVATMGCVAGLALSRLILSGLVSFELPGFIALSSLALAVNGRMLAFAALVSVASALLVSIASARTAAATDVISALKHGGSPAGRGRARQVLVGAHVALSIVLVFGAGLFVRSLQTALSVDVGFDASRIVVADPDVRAARFSDARTTQYFDAAVARLSSAPGAESVSYGSSAFFMSGNSTPRVIVDGRDLRLAQNVMQFQGGPAYFRTMGFRLLRGRDFADADQPDAQRVAVVNNAFAQRFWPGGDALGHRIGLPPDTIDATIVGVIEDGKYSRLDETQQLAVFGASKQQRSAFARRGLIVRTADPKRVIPELQKLIPAVDPAVPVSFVRPLTELIERGVLPQRLGSWLLSGLGAVALMLAVLGIYGLLACLVAQRTYEIGIRVALGAERRDVARLVLGSVVWSVGAGVVAGTITVWWLSSFISKLLFGVGPHDSLALASTLALIAAAALAGAAGPARRATRVDPVVALRAE